MNEYGKFLKISDNINIHQLYYHNISPIVSHVYTMSSNRKDSIQWEFHAPKMGCYVRTRCLAKLCVEYP